MSVTFHNLLGSELKCDSVEQELKSDYKRKEINMHGILIAVLNVDYCKHTTRHWVANISMLVFGKCMFLDF